MPSSLIFLTETSFRAVQNPARGLHHELALIRRWQESPERSADSGVVLIDCIGLTNEQLTNVALLRPGARTFRIDGRHAQTATGAERNSALDRLVEELVQRRLDGAIRLFPRVGAPPPTRYYQPSWAAAGGASWFGARPGFSNWDGEERGRIPMRQSATSAELQLPIKHVAGPEDWWAAVVGFRMADDQRWQTADLRGHRFVTIEAKLDRVVPGGVPLGIRLEDDSTDSESSSGHQSTGWLSPQPRLREYYVEVVP